MINPQELAKSLSEQSERERLYVAEKEKLYAAQVRDIPQFVRRDMKTDERKSNWNKAELTIFAIACFFGSVVGSLISKAIFTNLFER